MKNLCDCFLQLIKNGSVNFYSAAGILMMPFIPNSNYRFNNCPCCSKELRDVTITKSDLIELGIPTQQIK